MEEIKIFNNDEFGKVRTVKLNNKTYFVGNDIANALGYSECAKAIRTHCKGVSEMDIPSNGGIQKMKVITEGDVYRLIVRSKLPNAEKFESWVFDEVLPSIRKNGGYIQGQENLSDTELLAKAILVAQRTIEERDKKIAEQSSLIEEQKPLVTFALNVTDSEHSMDIGEFAKIVNKKDWNLGRNKLFRWLRDKKIFMDNNVPYQKYIDSGYFTCIEVNKSSEYGNKNFSKSLITPKGQVWLTNKLQEFVDDFFDTDEE